MKTEKPDVFEYLRILKKRRRVFVFFFLVVFSLIVVGTYLATPVYRATAQVYIDQGANSELTIEHSSHPYNHLIYIQTQIDMLKSEPFARKVVERVDPALIGPEIMAARANKSPVKAIQAGGVTSTANKPDKKSTFKGLADYLYRLGRGITRSEADAAPVRGTQDLASSLSTLPAGKAYKPDDEETDAMVRKFMGRLRVKSVENSSIIQVSYKAEDPVQAAEIVNETVQAFIEQDLEMKVTPARQAMSWLNEMLNNVKQKIEDSTDDLQDFKKQKGLTITGNNQTNISLQALSDLNAKALAAEAERYAAEIKRDQINKLKRAEGSVMSHPDVINNRLVQDLKSQQGYVAKQIAESSKKFGEKHPQMVRLKTEMDALDMRLAGEVGLIVDSINNDYEEAVKKEASLKRALAQQQVASINYERSSSEYEIKRQELEGARDVYAVLLKKFQESNLLGNANMSNVQFLGKAVPPRIAETPKKALNIALGFFVSLFAGVAFSFVFEYMDNSYKSPEDIEEHLGLPFLGIVPTTEILQNKNRPVVPEVVANPTSHLAEAFRHIRSNILLAKGDSTPRLIQICSAEHSEGKSTVAYNLASIMATAGETVLLIDGDMRLPKLHKNLSIMNKQGLSNLLSHQLGLEQVIRNSTVKGLDIITAGPIPPNPGELLGSKTMRDVLEKLKEHYDRIIIDSPAFLGIADSNLMAANSDGVVLVVRSGKTSKDNVLRTYKSIQATRSKLLGVILNDQAGKSMDYYQNHNYNYYYSEKSEKKAARSRAA